jgi:hypothetical protein
MPPRVNRCRNKPGDFDQTGADIGRAGVKTGDIVRLIAIPTYLETIWVEPEYLQLENPE